MLETCISNSKVIMEANLNIKISNYNFRKNFLLQLVENFYLKEDVNNINLNEKENPSYIPKKYLDRLHSIENTPGIRLRSALCHEKCVYKCSKCEKHLLPECFTKYLLFYF